MRLIDADKIDFNEVFVGASDFARDTREAAQSLIDNQPTAYDVEKVVEQINETREIFESRHIAPCINTDKATEIVRKGGIE